ncbi:hypothetical protein BJV77DRAFT_965869 [Russula vinacea]|nr:hypothetical protein BJV77DRAFT_965869 [Russula vinacea]
MPSSSYNLNLNKHAVEDPLGPNFLGTLYRDSFEPARTILTTSSITPPEAHPRLSLDLLRYPTFYGWYSRATGGEGGDDQDDTDKRASRSSVLSLSSQPIKRRVICAVRWAYIHLGGGFRKGYWDYGNTTQPENRTKSHPGVHVQKELIEYCIIQRTIQKEPSPPCTLRIKTSQTSSRPPATCPKHFSFTQQASSRACQSQVTALLHDEATNNSVHDGTPASHVAQHTSSLGGQWHWSGKHAQWHGATEYVYRTNAYHTPAFEGSRVAGNLENRSHSRIRGEVGVLVVVAA